jgi:cell wall-associated NlpC family hydrolase
MPEVGAHGRHRQVIGRHRNVMRLSRVNRPISVIAALAIGAALLAVSPWSPKRSDAASLMVPSVTGTITLGSTMRSGTSIVSSNKQFALVMQVDGNLVFTAQGQALWNSGTVGKPGAWAAMQTDGNLVVYSAAGVALWSSRTSGHPDAKAIITTDGNFAIVGASATYWQTMTVDSTLGSGRTLVANQSLFSKSHEYVLMMQSDGNLVMYGQTATWTTHTSGNPGAWVAMQTDGNLVEYSAAGRALWDTQTNGKGGATLQITDSNNLAVTSPQSVIYWQSAPPRTSGSSSTGTPVGSAPTTSTLAVGHWLGPAQSLTNGGYQLQMQTDGNLVLRGGGRVLWATNTVGHPGAALVMQGDGNLVIYKSQTNLASLWSARSYGTGATTTTLGSDGNILISTAAGVAVFEAPGGAAGLKIVAAASRTIGLPYCWDGGTQYGPTNGIDNACTGKVVGYDCSGLALYAVYQATHVLLDHYSGSQYNNYASNGGVRVARSALKPGDLVFFVGDDGDTAQPGHVGIYAGNGKIIDAQQDGVPVAVHSIYSDYVGAVRYWH